MGSEGRLRTQGVDQTRQHQDTRDRASRTKSALKMIRGIHIEVCLKLAAAAKAVGCMGNDDRTL